MCSDPLSQSIEEPANVFDVLSKDPVELSRGHLVVEVDQAVAVARHRPQALGLRGIEDRQLAKTAGDRLVLGDRLAEPLGQNVTPQVEQRLEPSAQGSARNSASLASGRLRTPASIRSTVWVLSETTALRIRAGLTAPPV
jgi:hypothetical protein